MRGKSVYGRISHHWDSEFSVGIKCKDPTMVETLKNKLKTVRISCFPVAWSLRVSVPGYYWPLIWFLNLIFLLDPFIWLSRSFMLLTALHCPAAPFSLLPAPPPFSLSPEAEPPLPPGTTWMTETRLMYFSFSLFQKIILFMLFWNWTLKVTHAIKMTVHLYSVCCITVLRTVYNCICLTSLADSNQIQWRVLAKSLQHIERWIVTIICRQLTSPGTWWHSLASELSGRHWTGVILSN